MSLTTIPASAAPRDRAETPVVRPRPDGLPSDLRDGLEALSGIDLGNVTVHRNAEAPARFGARAFAQGDHVYLAPGEGPHLAHEAWHVVQQRQGRVRATSTVAGAPLNDDVRLEREADTMGARARALGASGAATIPRPRPGEVR